MEDDQMKNECIESAHELKRNNSPSSCNVSKHQKEENQKPSNVSPELFLKGCSAGDKYSSNNRQNLDDGIEAPKWKFWRRKRYIVTLMTFLGFFNVLALRAIVSVAVTAMTTKNTVILDNGTSLEVQEYDWDSRLQGLILGSYFYGYISTQILGGWLASKYGGNVLFGFGIAITSVLTLFTPLLISVNVYWFVAVRVIEGVFEGVSYPSMHDLWAHWAPPLERSRLATVGYAGSYFGTVIAFTLSGILADNLEWPSIFYVFGCFGIIWCPAWVILVKRGPEYDSNIDPREHRYIRESLASADICTETANHPWGKFFSSMPVWAIIVANFAENWGMYTLLTGLPTYMKDTLEFDMKASGIMSSLPPLVVGFTMQIAGQIADFILVKKYLTTTQVRKAFCCGAFICQAVFMLATGFVTTPEGAVSCLTLAAGLGSFAMSGFLVNHLDLAPQHASILMGIGNTSGTLPGILCPTVIGFLVPTKAASEWKIVFFITSGVYLGGALFYGFFASGEKQKWAMTHTN